MPPRPLSADEIRAFRDDLCRVATRHFAESGYAGVTLRGLAAELGCSPMTPYRYFRNKEHIFAVVRSEALRRFAARVRDAAASENDPLERIVAIGRAYVRFACDEPDSFRIMFDLLQPESDDYPEVGEALEEAWSVLGSTVDAAIASGRIEGCAATIAHVCWANVHGLATLHLAGRLQRGKSVEELIDPVVRNAVQGLTFARKTEAA